MELTYETVSNQGERVLEGDRAGLIAEHRHRYEFALKFLAKTDFAVDCACGSGYGSEVLVQKAQKVLGIDISPVAIDYARRRYLNPNLSFELGSAEALTLATQSVDLFCSFETIEHIPNPELLVSEAARVLKPNRAFLVSTPNRVVTGLSSGQTPPNPFHLREWSLKEFDHALRRNFKNVQYFGQRIKSQNKFQPNYIASKIKRLTGQRDIVGLGSDPNLLEQLEKPTSWQPMIFIAVCR